MNDSFSGVKCFLVIFWALFLYSSISFSNEDSQSSGVASDHEDGLDEVPHLVGLIGNFLENRMVIHDPLFSRSASLSPEASHGEPRVCLPDMNITDWKGIRMLYGLRNTCRELFLNLPLDSIPQLALVNLFDRHPDVFAFLDIREVLQKITASFWARSDTAWIRSLRIESTPVRSASINSLSHTFNLNELYLYRGEVTNNSLVPIFFYKTYSVGEPPLPYLHFYALPFQTKQLPYANLIKQEHLNANMPFIWRDHNVAIFNRGNFYRVDGVPSEFVQLIRGYITAGEQEARTRNRQIEAIHYGTYLVSVLAPLSDLQR